MEEKSSEKEGKNVELLLANATKMPFRDSYFDKIRCSEVIERIPNYEQAIREIARVLKSSGKLVVTTPNKFSLYGPIRYTFNTTFRKN